MPTWASPSEGATTGDLKHRERRVVARALLEVTSLLGLVLVAGRATGAEPAEPLAAIDAEVRRALDLERDPEHGAALYRQQCAGCHGEDAFGKPAGPPALAGQRRAYLIEQLGVLQSGQREGAELHSSALTQEIAAPQAWADIASYLNQLLPNTQPQAGDGSALELGESVYQQDCASCHREDARGDDDGFVPSLRGQHYEYLLSQMSSLAQAHRRNVNLTLAPFMKSFSSAEMSAIADYLSRMRGVAEERRALQEDASPQR